MQLFSLLSLLTASVALANAVPSRRAPAGPKGIDVSDNQGPIDWSAAKADGVTFAYIKATEGHTFIDETFNNKYTGATNAGLIRGGYHFAHPDSSSGAVQAEFFLAHGGGWSADGRTLPGALDLEQFESDPECYGLSHSAMVSWIKDFSDTYHHKTGVFPVLYTTTNWWIDCTGNSAEFASTNPLWIAHWGTEATPLPAGWEFQTFWQYDDRGPEGKIDQDVFNGSAADLKRLALG